MNAAGQQQKQCITILQAIAFLDYWLYHSRYVHLANKSKKTNSPSTGNSSNSSSSSKQPRLALSLSFDIFCFIYICVCVYLICINVGFAAVCKFNIYFQAIAASFIYWTHNRQMQPTMRMMMHKLSNKQNATMTYPLVGYVRRYVALPNHYFVVRWKNYGWIRISAKRRFFV